MKSWLILFLVLVVCNPTTTLANSNRVLSGDHTEGFSRLVVPIILGSVWEIKKQGGNVRLEFTQNAPALDASDVFARISRSRINDVTADPGGLTLMLACDCTVYTFRHSKKFVVIDVADAGVDLPTTQIADVGNSNRTTSTEMMKSPDPLTKRKQLLIPAATFSTSRPRAINQLSSGLVNEIGKAATKGLLKTSNGKPYRRKPQINPGAFEAEPEALNHTSATSQIPQSNLRISSSMDLPGEIFDGARAHDPLLDNCPGNESFAISDWASEQPFGVQISQLRDSLYGVTGRLDAKVATELAQRYLYFGFGAEARQILSLQPKLSQENQLLLVLADILEYEKSRSSNLDQLIACNTNAALWAILAHQRLSSESTANTKAALRALNELPIHLRQPIAASLSKKLLELGNSEAATTALRSIERRGEPLLSAAKLSQAKISIELGQHEKAFQKLEDVVDDNSSQSPNALILLVERQLAEDQPVDPETADLVAAYAKELKGTALGPRLGRTHVLALLKSGQFSKAFSAKEEVAGNTQDRLLLNSIILAEMTRSANDLEFLNQFLQQRPNEIAVLQEGDLIDLAARLLNLGFPIQAQKVLENLAQPQVSEAAKILFAKISIAMDQPFQAQAHLIGVESTKARPVRAEAMRLAGNLENAHDLFLASGDTQMATEVAMLAGLWESESILQDETLSTLSKLTTSAVDPVATGDGVLESTQKALDESENARIALSNLLQDLVKTNPDQNGS